mmetsp:Transcript_22749/g.56213  ORF Transcript_22749/g.56213 Transcript_22749/m.56213 type:complete len:182 (+) Transcript_22749:69-614(+)
MSDWTHSLLKYSPKHARKTWIYINSFVLTCSILLLIEVFMTLEPEDRLEGTRAYLTYNTVVCFAWTIESALHFVQYRHEQKEKQAQATTDGENSVPERDNEFYAIVVELIFAVYFLYDALATFKVMWQQPSSVGAQLFDVTVDAVAYIYLLTRLVMFTEDPKINGIETQDETTPYVGAEMI